jgi:hypothetical protein
MLKKLMMSAAFAALLTSPALAQSYDPSAGSGNLVGPSTPADSGSRIPHYNSSGKIVSGHGGALGAYAYAPKSRHDRD